MSGGPASPAPAGPVPASPAAAPARPRPALGEIYASEFDAVWHVLRRLGVPPADLEDSVHDTFLVVQRRLAEYDPARPLRPWVLGVACRVAAHARRAVRARREDPADGFDATDERPRPDDEAALGQTRSMLARALEQLPEERRQVVVLHELHGLSMPEVAEVVEAPLNTLYSRLRLARRDLEKALRELGTEVAA